MRKNNFIFVFVSILLVSAFIGASGVSSPYWDENPLYMKPGTSETVILKLQNMVGGEDVTFKAKIVSGEGIVSLEEDTFFVPFGSKNVEVPLEIDIPRKANLDDVYSIQVSFVEVAEGGEQVQITTSITKSFDVIVTDRVPGEPVKSYSEVVVGLSVALGVVILIVVGLLLKNKKSKKSSKGMKKKSSKKKPSRKK